jgi:hypothetical protein
LTDIAWKGASLLAASSGDGYITFVQFDKDELGQYANPEKYKEKEMKSYLNYLNVNINNNIAPVHNGKNLLF